MIILPYSTEVLVERKPVSNIAIIAICIVMFVLMALGVFSESTIKAMALSGWNPLGLFTHQFLHAGVLHLGFNMLYLWVFGNTLNAKLGNLTYFVLFLTCGITAAALHNLLSGGLAIGASGAINGIIGFYLILHPINRISCFWLFPLIFMIRWGTFEATGFWLILTWFLIDALMAVFGAGSQVAYWGHIGGFLGGVCLGVVFLKSGWVEMSQYDNPTLLDYLKGKRTTVSKQSQPASASPSAASDLARTMIAQREGTTATATFTTTCPHCEKPAELSRSRIGQPSACPLCGGVFVVDDA